MPRRPDMAPLRREQLDPDPIAQFAKWFELASIEVPLPEAMALATVDESGTPDARMVLLKGFGPDGFRFFTNRESTKGRQLAERAEAALVIYWRELDRQVRVRGAVEQLAEADSDTYFATRARDSQLGAWASPQSRPIESREALDQRLAAAAKRFEGVVVPRPGDWGGYLIRPRAVEFWQGQVGRLHDRFAYRRDGDDWAILRLAP